MDDVSGGNPEHGNANCGHLTPEYGKATASVLATAQLRQAIAVALERRLQTLPLLDSGSSIDSLTLMFTTNVARSVRLAKTRPAVGELLDLATGSTAHEFGVGGRSSAPRSGYAQGSGPLASLAQTLPGSAANGNVSQVTEPSPVPGSLTRCGQRR